ncbi:MAG: class C beta-lactamase-related serine hydrolase [Planctomycetes bacterium]|nr:class C beta-lactamase-related serine hydrolase [Planctomycetota bacterium]
MPFAFRSLLAALPLLFFLPACTKPLLLPTQTPATEQTGATAPTKQAISAPQDPSAQLQPAPKQLPPPDALTAALAQIAAGYAAKTAASAIFISGRTLESVLDEELAPDTPIQALVRPFLRLDVDRQQQAVTAVILQASATAAYVAGFGCTLTSIRRANDLRLRAYPPIAKASTEAAQAEALRPWPLGSAGPVTTLPAGISAAALQAAIDYAFIERDAQPLARTRAVLVVKNGQLLGERYASHYNASMPLPGWSATKTITDALLGRRVAQGKLDPNAPLMVPEWHLPNDPRRALRLDDLLRMQSGLAWTEDYESPSSDALRMLFTSDDYGSIAAAQPLASKPRTTFRYSSGTTCLLCRILRTTFLNDADYLAFPQRELFARLGMDSAYLELDPSGTFVGSSFGYATARDWAKIGQFYLQDGVWNGERLLPEGWVAEARTPTASDERGGFGRHLWLNAGRTGQQAQRPFEKLPTDLFYLSGHEGQYVVCFPSQSLVVVRLGCTKRGGFDLHGFLQKVLRACST